MHGATAATEGVIRTLASHLDRPLGLVDVGCRWGFADAWESLAGVVRLVGFDPDAGECAQLRDRYAGRSNVEVVARGLDAKAARRVVHLTAEPACSSFFPPDRTVIDHVADLAVMRPVGNAEIETGTLDEWLQETDWGPADYIKLDVQGAEADVLLGSTRALADTVVMEIEVEFNALYTGQPLFADVDSLARSRGFQLWRLSNLAHYVRDGAPPHAPIADVHYCDSRPVHWDSPGGQLFWAHALYVADDVVECTSLTWQRLLRAGCIAGAIGLHDLALHAWMGASRAAPEPSSSQVRTAISDYRDASAEEIDL